MFFGDRDAASLLSRVVSESTVNKPTRGTVADATDASSATLGMVVVENAADECRVSKVGDGSAKTGLVVEELTVFDEDVSCPVYGSL